jgi:hypothetical protein
MLRGSERKSLVLPERVLLSIKAPAQNFLLLTTWYVFKKEGCCLLARMPSTPLLIEDSSTLIALLFSLDFTIVTVTLYLTYGFLQTFEATHRSDISEDEVKSKVQSASGSKVNVR